MWPRSPRRPFASSVIAAATLLQLTSSCWWGGLTPEICCNLAAGATGNEACWDGEYTYQRCCSAGSPKASEDVEALQIDAASVPGLPLLGGGSMPMSGLGLCCRPSANGDAVRQGVLDFLLMGGRHLDDAQIYSNQREVGMGVRQAVELGVPRSEIFLTTKIPPDRFGFEAASEWLSAALQELGLEYIDLVILHWAGTNELSLCSEPKACRQETWMALQRSRGKGQIRHLGVSNFGPRQMEELLALGGAPIEVNQIEYHPWVPSLHLETAQWCHEHGIAVTAYGSMGSSALSQQMLTQDSLRQIGDRHGKSSGQVLLRWTVQHNVSVIPGTGNPKHMAQNLGIFDFTLTGGEMAMLDHVPLEGRMLHFGHYPDLNP